MALCCEVDGFPVQAAASEQELKAVCHLRFEVYVGELKRDNYSYVDPVEQLLEDPLDHIEGVVNLFHSVEDASLTDVEQEHGYVKPLPDRRIVSGARVHVPSPDKYAAMFGNKDSAVFGEELVADQRNFAFFSRFMVHSSYRRVRGGSGGGLADALYAASYAAAREQGAKIMLLNCTPALSPYYERFGFVRYKPAYCDAGMGLQIPLAMALEDIAFLQRVAPKGALTLAALHEAAAAEGRAEEGSTGASCRWLASILEQRPLPLVSYLTIEGVEGMRAFLSGQANVTGMDSFSIFEGVTAEERALYFSKVPSAMSVIDIPAGSLLTNVGDVRDEAYLLLQGTMATEDHPEEVLHPGVVVGEVSFLSGTSRAYSTTCTSDCLVMVRLVLEACVRQRYRALSLIDFCARPRLCLGLDSRNR